MAKNQNKERSLTIKQEAFANKYVECGGNASEAYRFAYDTSRTKDEVVAVKASELMKNGNVSVRIRQLQQKLEAKSDITKERVLGEFAKVAFSSIAYLHNTWIERKEFEELTDEQKASIKSISTKTQRVLINDKPVEVEFVKVELYDKIKALENINKMLGFEAPVRNEHGGINGNPIQHEHGIKNHTVTFKHYNGPECDD